MIKRDIFGIKPLYYTEDGHTSSSIKPLLKHVEREVDFEALNHYLAFRCTPENKTMFKGIFKVPPGCELDGKIKRYWDIEYNGEYHDGSLLFDKMMDAVERNLESKQGLFLSGGMDSSTILAMCREMGHDIMTFSAGFDVEGYDELEEARKTADYFGTNHIDIKLKGNICFKDWPMLVNNFEEPMADPTKFPVYYLCEIAKNKGIKSILVGEGGDENFASYSQYKFMRWHWWMKHVPITAIRATPDFIKNRFFKYISDLGDMGINRFQRFAKSHVPAYQYQYLVSIFSDNERGQLLKKKVCFHPIIEDVNDMVKTDIKKIMAEDLLMKMHKNAQPFGIEGKFPFLDKELFEYTARLNPSTRLRGKEIMKKTMKGILPDFILNRKKSRFFVPIHKWGINEIFESTCTKENTEEFNYSYIKKMIEEYDKSPLFYARQMFALIDFTLWKKMFIWKQ